MSIHDQAYHGLLQKILDEGFEKTDRTGTGTLALFGEQLKFDLREGFPLLTTKKVYTKAIVHELIWFISGSTNIKYLLDNGVHIWDEWTPAYKQGGKEEVLRVWNETLKFKDDSQVGFLDRALDIGPAYGFQWRNFGAKWTDLIPREGIYILEGGVDQLGQAIHKIRNKPDDRRIIVSAWDPSTVDECQLPPCHCFFQFNVHGDTLHLNMYQRSCDVFLGVPFNIASYALLLEMVAHITGLKAGVFTHHYGDVHIYKNHIDQVREQLSRDTNAHKAPKVWLSPGIKEIDEFTYGDVLLLEYDSYQAIKAPVAV